MEAEGLEPIANLPSRNKSLIEIGLPAIKSRIISAKLLVRCRSSFSNGRSLYGEPDISAYLYFSPSCCST